MVLHLIPDIDVLFLAISCVAREQVYSERMFLISKVCSSSFAVYKTHGSL